MTQFSLERSSRHRPTAPQRYPLTGIGCVKRIYSDLATLECTPQGLRLIDAVNGLAYAELEKLVGLPIIV